MLPPIKVTNYISLIQNLKAKLYFFPLIQYIYSIMSDVHVHIMAFRKLGKKCKKHLCIFIVSTPGIIQLT